MSHPHIALFGAGAIGLYLTGRLAHGGVPVSLIARPNTAATIRTLGITLDEDGDDFRLDGNAPGLWVGDAAAMQQRVKAAGHAIDLLLIVTKSQQLVPALPDIIPLISAHTQIVCLQNGIPWWYFQGLDHPSNSLIAAHAGRSLAILDPDGQLPAALPPERVIGGVIHKSAELNTPGHVIARRAEGDRFIFGSPASPHETAGEIALIRAFRQAGLPVEHSADIRLEAWKKLLGNAVLNPLSALTDATLTEIIDFPASRQLAAAAMAEATAVAHAYGIEVNISSDERLQRARTLGAVRTSMLQDKARGREMEVDGILGGLIELARLAAVPVPRLETLYAAAALLSRRLA